MSQPARHAATDFGLQMQSAMNVTGADRAINLALLHWRTIDQSAEKHLYEINQRFRELPLRRTR